MNLSRYFMVVACAGMAVVCSLAIAGEKQLLFQDDFNRDDADVVGNKWSTTGAAVLKNNAVLFKLKQEEFRPRLQHAFPLQKEGKFVVSFELDWLRESEGTWGVSMQLGNSAEIPRLLIYDKDLSQGIGVNLVWGGGEVVNSQTAGSFGYSQNGEFKPLFVMNDKQNEKTIVEKAVVIIDVDVDAATYAVKFDGKTYPDLPFDNNVPVDTIRFIANGCSELGFSKSSIDDVTITRSE